MFMKFTDATSSQPTVSYPYYGSAPISEPPQWIGAVELAMFVVGIVVNVFVVLLNVTVCVALWRATRVKEEYKACFYIIMRTFNCFVAVNALGSLATQMDKNDEDFTNCWWIQAVLLLNMFTCIASSIWLFYAGLNRMMVLVYPKKMLSAWGCWFVRITLIIASLLALSLSVVYQKLCGMYTRYDVNTNTIQVVASNMAEPLTIAVYAFPLFSLVFYAIAYNNLRQKRLLVTSDKTKSIIDKAERKTLKIGMIIMVTYTLALVVHIYIVFGDTNETYDAVYSRIDELVSTAPQIALPMALLTCNKKLFTPRKKTSQVGSTSSGTVQDLYSSSVQTKESRIATASKIRTESKNSDAF